MSMYTQLLGAALEVRGSADPWSAVGSPLPGAQRHQCQLPARPDPDAGVADTGALADQIAYDIALIELARSVGVACAPSEFDQPQKRRHELERELASRGIRSVEDGAPAHSAPPR
ncbi:MAG: hypothetical protein ACLPVF_13560 [Acidimicrobiales bacterium]